MKCKVIRSLFETVIRGQLLRRTIKVSFFSLTSTCEVVEKRVNGSIINRLVQPAVRCNEGGLHVENP
jgi:hypothetical protein